MTRPGPPPVPLLFLIGDTGGGHRSAAQAVAQALDRTYPGRFAPVIWDPLRGPGSPLRLRWLVSLYGPCIRLTPWLWGLLWRSCGSPRTLRWARRSLLAPANRSVARAVTITRPAAIVAFHAFTTQPAVRARDRITPGAPVITVITDLITTHLAWRDVAVDLVTGGAEGSGGIYRRAVAILRELGDVDVVVICGRNRRLRRRMNRLAARARRCRHRPAARRPGGRAAGGGRPGR